MPLQDNYLLSMCVIKAFGRFLNWMNAIPLWWNHSLGHTASQCNVCVENEDAKLSLPPTRSVPSNSLLMDTKTQISTCASLRRSLCRKIPTASSSCSLSDSWCLITSSETQACGQSPSTTSIVTLGVFDLIPFISFCSDRGNDNWLLKYDCPMDSVGTRVRTVMISSFSSILIQFVFLFN